MNKHVLVVALALAACTTFADDAAPAAPPKAAGEKVPPRLAHMPLITALDANADGTIDAQEIAAAADALKKLDTNGDGKLSPDEYLPAHRGPAPDGAAPAKHRAKK